MGKKRNIIVGQSGGPTSVINSSLAGVYKNAIERGFNKVYGMLHGIQGLLDEQYIDLSTQIHSEIDIELLKRTPSAFLGSCRYKLPEIHEDMDPLQDLYDLIERAIVEEPPIVTREGGMIKEGYNEEADKLRHAKTEGKTWLAELEARERDKTGIKNLKIKYNKVFGYYFEVTNSFKDLVPDYFIRKQTLANAERYTTDELKNLEDIILASNANIGGPTTAAGMAISQGWTRLVGPSMLVGTFGYVIGTYLGIIVGSLLGA